MSQFGGIGSVDTAVRNTPSQFSEMKSEDFIKIIFTELANQDPFDPNDSAALLQQLSSLRSIETDMQLSKQLESLVSQNQLAAAGNLVGKFVGGLTSTFDRVAGWAVAVHREGDKVSIELDSGWMVPMSGIETILDPSIFDEQGDVVDNNSASGGSNNSNNDQDNDDDATG
jgi:flagellar basal-body rod modification protein FlgD